MQKTGLPTLRDVLLECDRTALAKELERRYEMLRDEEPKPTVEQCAGAIDRTLAEVERCKPDVTKENVLIPQLGIEQDILETRSMEFAVTTAAYETRAVVAFAQATDAGETPEIPMGYAYEIDERANILGHLVYMPARLCDALRTEAICDMFWELTFFGIDTHHADERSKELKDSLIEQSKAIEDGTIETLSHEEVMAELEKRYGWEPPEVDEELERQLVDACVRANKALDDDLKADIAAAGRILAAHGIEPRPEDAAMLES